MKKMCLLFILLFCLALPSGAAAKQNDSFQYYQNARFGYSLVYPDFFTQIQASDNGDGLTFADVAGKYSLKVWGQNNINSLTAQGRLTALFEREISHIRDSFAQDDVYWVIWSDDGGKDGHETIFYEYGRVLPDKLAVFRISFPAAEFDRFRLSTEGEIHLNLIEERDYMELVSALAQSQISHYDSFSKDQEPDWRTVNNVLRALVDGRHFGGGYTLVFSKTDESAQSLYFRRGPEDGEKDIGNYTPPDKLYQAYFAKGQYKYPKNDYPFVQGTQMGIVMNYSAELGDRTVAAKFTVLEEKDAGSLKNLRIALKRMDYNNNKETNVGEATVILQKDPDAYFGWTILSYTPTYAADQISVNHEPGYFNIAVSAGGPVLDFVINPEKVSVYTSGNSPQLLQVLPKFKLPYDPDYLPDVDETALVEITDMNFDGYQDVKIMSSMGNVNIYYDCWLWNQKKKKFVLNEELSALSLLSFDAKTKTVNSFTRYTAADNSDATYIFRKGKLQLVEITEQTYNKERNLFTIAVYRSNENNAGKLELVSREEFTREEMDKREKPSREN